MLYAGLIYFYDMKTKKQQAVKIILSELDPGGYHLFINLKVNGKRCRFLIDTGASRSVVDKAYYDKNLSRKKLTTIEQETTSLHASTSQTHIGTIREIELGGRKIKNHVIAAIDLSHVNNTYKQLKTPKIHGILGSDLMHLHKMIIDYGQNKLIIP